MMARQLITTPQVSVYQGEGGGKVEKALADVSFDIATVTAQKAEKKYEMDFQNAAASGINEAYGRNQNNPEQLQKELESIRGGLIEKVPFKHHDGFNAQFKRAAQPYVNKSTNNHGKLITDQLKESSLKNIDLAKTDLSSYAESLLSDNPVMVADATAAGQEKIREAIQTISLTDANGMPVFSASERFRMSKDLIDNTIFTSVRAGFDDAEDKKAFLEKFDSGELTASIFLDDGENFISSPIRDRMDRKVFEKTINYMESEIDQIEKEAEKRVIQENNIKLIDGVMSGEAILDPTRKQHKKAIEDYYTNLAPIIANLPSDQRTSTLIDFVSTAGVWPDTLKSSMVASLSNGSPEQKSSAADLINAISEQNPQTINQISDSVRARAKAIANNINAGMDPEDAVAYAENSVFKKDSPEYKVRLKRFTDPKDGERVEFNEGDFTKLFRDDPDIPDGMIADYDTLNRAYYMDEGLDAKGASELATQKIKSQWRITSADGNKRWMKYAPEAIYENQAGTEWIGEQLKHDLGSIPQIVDPDNPPEIYLSVAPSTIRQPDPSYLVFMKDGDGVLQPFLTERGKQAVFKPDFETSPTFKKLVKEFDGDKEAAMIAARNRRRIKLKDQEKDDRRERIFDAKDRVFMNTLNSLLGRGNADN